MKFNTKDGERELFLSRLDSERYALITIEGDSVLSFKYVDDELSDLQPDNLDEEQITFKHKIDSLLFAELQNDFSGIEEDDNGEPVDLETDPFNPNDVSIDTKPITMETLLRRLEQNTIKLNPDFQRNEVWNNARRSQLIESLLLNIPIPMFYVSSDEKSNWTVVDGLQRLSTFRDYILGSRYLTDPNLFPEKKGEGFMLTNLEFWKELEGARMNDLPVHLYNRIMETVFNFTIINPGTHEEVKRNIFKRLNTGGMPLSSQEIRNALYVGKATDLLNDLSSCTAFTVATCNSIKPLRMEDRELVLRFLSFVYRKPETYRRTLNIDTWLSDTMIIINSLPNLNSSRELQKCIKQRTVNVDDIQTYDVPTVKDKFETAMNRAITIFGDHAFRKSSFGMRRSPINKSLFETWGVVLSELSDAQFMSLCNNLDSFRKEYQSLMDDPSFIIAISRDSMKHSSVKFRFDKVRELVLNNC